MAARQAKKNAYYEEFARQYELHYSLPYSSTAADFVQLHHLTANSGKLSARLTLEVWQRGVENYFKSELGCHSLKHLCAGSNFVTFWRGPLDRYGKPREQASQVGAGNDEVHYASWHPRFLKAAWDLQRKRPAALDALCALFEQVADMDEQTAFARLREIETNG